MRTLADWIREMYYIQTEYADSLHSHLILVYIVYVELHYWLS